MKFLIKFSIFLIIFLFISYCSSTSKIEEKIQDNKQNVSVYENKTQNLETFQEEQPVYPVETDDPFFLKNLGLREEAFRVLITKYNYQIRQVQFKGDIERIKDTLGDKEQLKVYEEFYNQIDFKDWEFEGVLRIRINPQTSNIESIKYESHYIPKTQQAVKLFLEDVSRYKFKYLKQVPYPTQFLVRVLWRIQKNPELTEEQAKKRAIEYLKKYAR